MEKKTCKLCNMKFDLSNFYKCGGRHSSRCKSCFNLYQKNNPNKKANNERYILNNPDRVEESKRKKALKYYDDIEKSREYDREKRKRLRKKNLDHYLKYERDWKNKNYQRLKSDPIWALKKKLRARFVRAVKAEYKKTSCIELLGCSIEEFRLYLESQFTEGMTWENHGNKGWHIDHILPCDSFDLSDIEEQKKCFHYSNMQPLWAKDNLAKSNKILNE